MCQVLLSTSEHLIIALYPSSVILYFTLPYAKYPCDGKIGNSEEDVCDGKGSKILPQLF